MVFQCQILKYSMRGLLQHWTKSSVIHNSRERSVWRNKKPKKRTDSFEEDRLLTWSTSTSGWANDSVENRADLFTVVLRNDDSQEFHSKWDVFFQRKKSMTEIPSDEILESFYKLRTRESEKLKTVLELYNMVRRKLDLIIAGLRQW